MAKEIVFLSTWGTSRGGLSVDIDILSKEAFFKAVSRWEERIKDNPYYGYPKWRYAEIDGSGSKLFKNMSLGEFEGLFNEEERKRLGRLLEYKGKNHKYTNYPVFLKAIHLKHGYEKEITA